MSTVKGLWCGERVCQMIHCEVVTNNGRYSVWMNGGGTTVQLPVSGIPMVALGIFHMRYHPMFCTKKQHLLYNWHLYPLVGRVFYGADYIINWHVVDVSTSHSWIVFLSPLSAYAAVYPNKAARINAKYLLFTITDFRMCLLSCTLEETVSLYNAYPYRPCISSPLFIV